jgi:hypothetical protein
MMPAREKANACLTLVFAVMFYLFWQVCKQQPALAQVATFTEDPYDAIGSFGVLFALFTALLSVIRAFRPYQPDTAVDSQQVLLTRAGYLICLAVAVTLGADIVAMLRYPAVWIGFPAGYILVALVGGMALLTALMGWRIHHTARQSTTSARQGWTRAIVISLVGTIICALYPQNWRANTPVGGLWTVFILFTIVVGMVIFLTSVWVWGMVLSPPLETPAEDSIDDLAALYRAFKTRLGPFSVVLTPFEKVLGSSWLRPIVDWLNPRKNRWYGIALIGIAVGVALALGEAHLRPRIQLIEVFASITGVGVLMGYAFFAKSLALARNDTKSSLAPGVSLSENHRAEL